MRTTLTSPEGVRTMVDEAARAGFNTLIVQVRGRGDAFYRSSVEPRSDALRDQPPAFDPLAVVLEEAHARGLEVHAWLNTFLVWDETSDLPADPTHLVRARPDLLAVPRVLAEELGRSELTDSAYVGALLGNARENAHLVEGLYASPSAPEVHEHILRIVSELAERYPLDGVHLDYVRYPNAQYDYSASTLRAFREWVSPRLGGRRVAELDRAAAADPTAWPDELADEWAAFRRAAVTSLVRQVGERLASIRPQMALSAAVFADAEDATLYRFQEWPSWVQQGLLNVVAPMAYTQDDSTFQAQIDFAVRVAGRRRVWAGIGAWQNSFEGTVSKIGIAREEGAAGFSLFSYDWAAQQRVYGGEISYLEGVRRRAFER
jgi:uncharacterized lipoprotein YddW (UPF0748 family)